MVDMFQVGDEVMFNKESYPKANWECDFMEVVHTITWVGTFPDNHVCIDGVHDRHWNPRAWKRTGGPW